MTIPRIFVTFKQFCIAVCLLVIAVASGQAQQSKAKPAQPEVPNLGGEWVLDPARSQLDKEIHDFTLTVIQNASEIRFSKRYWRGKREIKEAVVVHTDGRSDVDPGVGINAESETRWQGQRLIRKITSGLSPASGYPVNLKFVTFEEWIISSDQQTLTRTITRDTGERISRAMFSRVH